MKRLTGCGVFLCGVCAGLVAALPGSARAASGAPQTQPAMVELNLPENIELKVLIDYVGKRLDISFLYDEQIGGKRVTIRVPRTIPVSSLMTLLDSALRMKGLAMHTDASGIVRIEPAKQLTASSTGPSTRPHDPDILPGTAVTRIFELKHVSPQRVDEMIKPFLSTPSAITTLLPEHNLLIATDYAENMARLAALVELVDRPSRDVQTLCVPIRHMEAAAMAQKVAQLLAGKAKVRGGAAGATVVADEQGGQVMLVGSKQEVAEALELITSLDVSPGLETRTYSFAVASAEQVDRIVREMLGDAAARRVYKSATDAETNVLVATSTPQVHEQIELLRKAMDKPAPDTQSPIRFYRLENAKATEIVATLQEIEGGAGLGDGQAEIAATGSTGSPEAGVGSESAAAPPPGESRLQRQGGVRGGGESRAGRQSPHRVRGGGAGSLDEVLSGGGSRVVADEPSNTIIVVARPALQAVYEKLIRRLDVRRPQVLVEATVVALDTTNNFSLGVEIAGFGSINDGKVQTLTFSSFGLSTVDPNTGSLTLRPGTGFNGVLLAPDVAEMVIRAVQSDSRARVMSRPSVLINDNARGELVSENEEPYSSVNASTTVATTSFAGYSSAGTRIIITPQISEGEYLKLKYEVTLSSFGADKSPSLPPPRQTNALSSEVTIPDGHTIVVGGLTRENMAESIDRLPILGSLPGLEYLFSNRSTTSRRSTLFVFLRAVILRGDKFEDLKALSREAVARAGAAGDLPASEPLVIE